MKDLIIENKWELVAFGVYMLLMILFRVYEIYFLKNKNK